jgi:single-strand DNA-binding protein
MRVVAQGRLKQRSFETREGEKRTVIELDVDEVGPSLRYATAKVNRTQRGSSSGGFGSSGSGGGDTVDDPWGTPPPPSGGGGFSDEPPF